MTPSRLLAITASYVLVASIAWTYGYICHVWIDRRGHELDSLFTGHDDEEVDFLDLVGEPPAIYDWAEDEPLAVAAEQVFEWPGGVTIAGPYPPETP